MGFLRFFISARKALPRVIPLFCDTRVPLHLKAAAVAAALLIVSPLDVFGDIPFIGLLDDAALLLLAANVFVFLAERATIRRATPYSPEPRIVTPRALLP